MIVGHTISEKVEAKRIEEDKNEKSLDKTHWRSKNDHGSHYFRKD
jgi:hypothetical protein